MAGKKTSPSSKAYFTGYKANGTQAKNQARKRARHLKAHPNDLQSATKAKAGYKRKTPKARNHTTPNTRFTRDASGKRIAWPADTFRPTV